MKELKIKGKITNSKIKITIGTGKHKQEFIELYGYSPGVSHCGIIKTLLHAMIKLTRHIDRQMDFGIPIECIDSKKIESFGIDDEGKIIWSKKK